MGTSIQGSRCQSMLGALLGSLQGAHFLAVAKTRWLRVVFMWVIVVLAVEMLYSGTAGQL